MSEQAEEVARMRLAQQTALDEQTEEASAMDDSEELPSFSPVPHQTAKNTSEYRRIRCPPHRYTPLRQSWEKILPPLVDYLHLLVRFNTKTRSVELKSTPQTTSVVNSAGGMLGGDGALQKGADFVTAFMLGFEVQDAVALLRLDDLYVDTFQVTDIKLLKGDHLSRAIGRVAGQDGKTRFAIENATRTRIIIADTRVSLLGSYANIRIARDAICGLVMGAPPGKVYNNMRGVAKRMTERF